MEVALVEIQSTFHLWYSVELRKLFRITRARVGLSMSFQINAERSVFCSDNVIACFNKFAKTAVFNLSLVHSVIMSPVNSERSY